MIAFVKVLFFVQLFFLNNLTQIKSPFLGEKVYGSYFDFLRTNKAIVEVWEGQAEYVAEIAISYGFVVDNFDEYIEDRKIIIIKYDPRNEDLILYLKKLGDDAGVENIRPAPFKFFIEDFIKKNTVYIDFKNYFDNMINV
jgi:hypothetical protein